MSWGGEEQGRSGKNTAASGRTPPLPDRGGRSPGAEEEVTAIGLDNQAAGEV